MGGRLDGKVAIITGAARGTGEATARAFVREGATVWIADLLVAEGAAVARDLGDAGRFVHHDVTSEESWQNVVEQVTGRDGRIDVLVNNAAILHLGTLLDTTADDFRRLNEVNQIGPFLGIRAVYETMRAQEGGSIVNIASIDGFHPKNSVIAYASSKFALRAITKVSAIELGQFGIRVNSVCPESGGPGMVGSVLPEGVDVESIMSAPWQWPILKSERKRSFEDRLGDIANLVVFLASDESASCTGGDYLIDGGHSAGRLVKAAGLPA